jgi:hypothetical protein
MKRRQTIVETISALLILLFLYTALSKSFDINKTISVLHATPWLSKYSIALAWTVVILEYIVSFFLFIPKLRKLGLYGSFILMISFTFYIAFMMSFVRHLPCSCGGVISKMSWDQHLIFNIFFSLLAFVAIFLERKILKLHQHKIDQSSIVFT